MNRAALSPITAVVAGGLAGAAGTAAMDALWYSRHVRSGGSQAPLQWEFGASVASWDDVSPPGQVGRRVAEGFLGHPIADRWARATQNVVHWATGAAWGAQFGMVAGSTERPGWTWGVALGPAAWLTSYAVLPLAKLYKPIWEYDAKTLAQDLSAHLVFGAVTGLVFAGLARARR